MLSLRSGFNHTHPTEINATTSKHTFRDGMEHGAQFMHRQKLQTNLTSIANPLSDLVC